MGAQQSSTQGSRIDVADGSTKTCYYELLGVERLATDNEIKKAYRRKALELHPDRNINDVATATKRFAEVQAAYEVLSDPQERAWYDSHRDTILSGQDEFSEGVEPTTFRNVRLTTTEEILSLMRKFNSTVPFDDEVTGFFGIAREVFEHLALEEEVAADFEGTDCPELPSFGFSDDSYEVVRPFYTAWAGFATRKSFSWKDKYRLTDAPDRRVRRLMEKENKKIRDEAAREFNDTVRFLVSFVRKRDPRYLPNTQTDADRQQSLRDAAAAQAARSRAANRDKYASYEVPEWARSKEGDSEQGQFSESEEESEVEILECVVCHKTFKSDKQLEAHERSKKHIKALQQLRYQMKKEGVDLALDSMTPDSVGERAGEDRSNITLPPEGGQVQDEETASPIRAKSASDNGKPVSYAEIQVDQRDAVDGDSLSIDSNGSRGESDGEEYAPRSTVADRLFSSLNENSTTEPRQVDVADNLHDTMKALSVEDTESQIKIGKAKAKRQKKAALRESDGEHRCSVCGTAFASRTKLFHHIRDEDHAAPISKISVGVEKKKKR